jgi:hypothetical protein
VVAEAAGAALDVVAARVAAVQQPAAAPRNPWHPVSIQAGGAQLRQQAPPRLLRMLQRKANAVRQFRRSALKGAAAFW